MKNYLAKLLMRLYIAAITFSLIIGTAQAQQLSDVVIIKGVSFDKLNEANEGDTLTLKLSDGKLLTQPLKLIASMEAENEYTKSYSLPAIKGRLVINKQENDIRGYIWLDESEYCYILDSWQYGYKFIRKNRNELINE